MEKFVKTLTRTTHKGERLPVGSVISLDEKNADSLVRGRFAAYCDENGEPIKAAAPTTGDKAPAPGTITDEAKVKKALDSQYKADELKDAAKLAGVEFAFDATKPVVIDAIVAQGKAAALLK